MIYVQGGINIRTNGIAISIATAQLSSVHADHFRLTTMTNVLSLEMATFPLCRRFVIFSFFLFFNPDHGILFHRLFFRISSN